jgi:hypothetical protein
MLGSENFLFGYQRSGALFTLTVYRGDELTDKLTPALRLIEDRAIVAPYDTDGERDGRNRKSGRA